MRVTTCLAVLVLAAAALADDGAPAPAAVPAPAAAAPAPAAPPPLVFLAINAQGAEEWLRVKDGATVVRVPRGAFSKRPYEPSATTKEPKSIPVESCFIDKYEVTNARFARFLAEQKGDLAKLWDARVPGVERKGEGFAATPGLEEFPVTAATGLGAAAYAAWAGGRIPTQFEWEKAAGGPQGRVWPWGDEAPDAARANFGRPAARGPERVGSHAAGASFYGCMDMAGNVYDRVITQRGSHAAPVMVKGGSWASPHPLNLRVLDLCMQPQEVADLTVGFRCAMDDPDPERATRTAEPAPVLKLATDFDAAVEEAKRRNVPVFLSLLFDTCGQCDRTRAELFRDPRFVAYCNENLVVIVGHQPGDAIDDPHPAGEGGACPLYPGVTCDQHDTLFARGLDVVKTFVVSPGNFVLHPAKVKKGAGADAMLVTEMELPKWGNPVDDYLAEFEKARKAMAPPAEPAK
jgi:formylglycine-generating enzyme required for sulfatase activity